MFIDVHAHLTDSKYGGEVEQIIENYRKVNVELVISSGYDIESSEKSKDLSSTFSFFLKSYT